MKYSALRQPAAFLPGSPASSTDARRTGRKRSKPSRTLRKELSGERLFPSAGLIDAKQPVRFCVRHYLGRSAIQAIVLTKVNAPRRVLPTACYADPAVSIIGGCAAEIAEALR
jgi:hypothetical protein